MNSTVGIIIGSLLGIGVIVAGTRQFLQSSPQPKYAYTSESAREEPEYPLDPYDITHVGGKNKKKNKKNTKRKKI
jgi:hypothetical protein